MSVIIRVADSTIRVSQSSQKLFIFLNIYCNNNYQCGRQSGMQVGDRKQAINKSNLELLYRGYALIESCTHASLEIY